MKAKKENMFLSPKYRPTFDAASVTIRG